MFERTLDLDVGNSRTKWRLTAEDRVETGVANNVDLESFFRGLIVTPSRVRAACVAGSGYVSFLRELGVACWGVVPEFATSSETMSGLVNRYQNPSGLGIDRWLAAVATWHASTFAACMIVDAGTALTVDVVGAGGSYHGGYIIPGYLMMQGALTNNTGQIHCEMQAGFPTAISHWPDNTRDAISYGAAFALYAVVAQAMDVFLNDYPAGQIYITGGDGLSLAYLLKLPERYFPDLVLDGLSIAIP